MLRFDELVVKDLNKLNNEKINTLRSVLDGGERLEFMIGAGVGVSVGLPNWVALVARTIARRLHLFELYDENGAVSQTTRELHSKISELECGRKKFMEGITNGYSNTFLGNNMLEIAEYVLNSVRERLHDNNKSLKDALANYSIAELVGDCLHMSEADLDKCLDSKYEHSTLEAIVEIISETYKKHGYQEVITYNYDDILEKCLEKKGNITKDKIKSISYTDKNTSFESGKVNVAHVHGKINVTDRGDMSDDIILSESSYYDMERSEYLWQHTVQARAMLDNPCLFVGFSAQDYNFRRIIKNSKNIKNTYILFTINEIVWNVCKSEMKNQALALIKEKINHLAEGSTISEDDFDVDKVMKKHEDEFLEKIFMTKDRTGLKNTEYDNYAYERLFITYLIKSQTDYWEKNNIKPIWTTIDEIPEVIKKIGSLKTK